MKDFSYISKIMKTNMKIRKNSKQELRSGWLHNLCVLMEDQGLNPRRLSLLAGLNSTAVRDMLDGRAKYPRYSTIKALADVLGTTPSMLMADKETANMVKMSSTQFADNVDLLTEIIARLQEILLELKKSVSPREFAAMASTIYKNISEDENKTNSSKKTYIKEIKTQIYNLCDYNFLRKK